MEVSKKKLRALSRKNLEEIRREKLRKEIESAKRVLQSGVEPLKVADEFIHDIFKIMEEGFYRRYPNLSEGQISQKIEDTMSFAERLRGKRQRRRNQ